MIFTPNLKETYRLHENNELPEKNRLPLSFALAAAVHILVLIGGFRFITPPAYGIQGSAASMEIYMVAALPESSRSHVYRSEDRDVSAGLLTAASEMEVVRKEKKSEGRRSGETNELTSAKPERVSRSNVRGDGSSAQPGDSVTTLFSRGSSETAGKAGKYQNPAPQYPSLAMRNGWEGVVMIKALIEKEGRPSKVVIDKTSGYRVLDEAALKAIKKWKFTAGSIGGMSISSWVKIPIRFELEDVSRQ